MMNSYIDETLRFIGSDEMRECLREHLQATHVWENKYWRSRHICSEIVAFAPASIEKKIPVLDLIASQTEYDPEHDYRDPAKFAREYRMALEERYNTPPGTMFWLRRWIYHKENFDGGSAFFATFDAAIRYIKELKEFPKDLDGLSYSIEKYIPEKNDVMEEYCTWVLNGSGELWYFDYERKYCPKDWDDIWDYCGDSPNLPVPFQPGDIILADCRPFSKERRVIILEIGDNSDCCCVQCLYFLPNGKVGCGALKHNHFHDFRENSHISGLYRARCWSEELPESEAPFAILSKAIKAKPTLGRKIGNWMYFNRTNSHDDERGCSERGASLEQLIEFVQGEK